MMVVRHRLFILCVFIIDVSLILLNIQYPSSLGVLKSHYQRIATKNSVANNVGSVSRHLSSSQNACTIMEDLGENIYDSVFKPCVFTFYKVGTKYLSKNATFPCGSLHTIDDDDIEIISSGKSRVVTWPDACVGREPRCYSLSEYPKLEDHVVSPAPDDFPDDASFVRVDCTADFQAGEANLAALGGYMVFFAIVMFLASIFCCVSLVFTCCWACCQEEKRTVLYTPEPYGTFYV